MDAILQDLRFALRSIRASRGFALAVVMTLALGIGANTAIFSAVDGVLVRPLPYPAAGELAVVSSVFHSQNTETIAGSSIPDFRDLRDQNRTFAAMAAAHTEDRNLAVASGAERVRVAAVTPGFFAVLGLPPALGREPAPTEEVWGQHRVAVLSPALHRRLFAGAADAVGRTVRLDGEDYTIIGVARPGIVYPAPRQDLYIPISYKPGDENLTRGNHFIQIIGRLAPGVSFSAGRADLEAIGARLSRTIPENQNVSVRVTSLREAVSGDLRGGLLVLLGAVGLVLLICCANLANLLLARGSARARELAVRAALGASRGRIVRQLLTESLLLALVGGALGVVLGSWLLDGVLALGPDSIRLGHDVRIDGRVLAFASALSLATGIGFGLVPALLASRAALADTLKEGARGTAGGRSHRLRQALVVAEIALALVLVAGAGLLTRSFAELSRVRLGFDPEGAFTGVVQLPAGTAPAETRRVFGDVVARLQNMPGVEAAAATTSLPMDGGGWGKYCSVEGRLATRIEDVALVQYRLVAGDNFRALRVATAAGRTFAASDGDGAPPVAIINQTAARVLFGAADPIGQRIFMTPPEALMPAELKARLAPWVFVRSTVVGVVADVKNDGPGQPAVAEVYRPLAQSVDDAPAGAALVVRGRGDLGALLRRAVAEVRPDQPVGDEQPLAALLSGSVAQPRFQTALVDSFAALALLLALLGVYGVMSYTISQRTQEMGIRLALGATPRSIVGLVLARGLVWIAIGLVLGLAGAFAAGRLAAGLLFGVSGADPWAFLGAVAAVVLSALLALFIPARRAARTSPLSALRTSC